MISKVNTEKKLEKKTEKKLIKNNLINTAFELECRKCDVKVDSQQKLKSHERIVHTTSISTQSSLIEFSEKSQQCIAYDFKSGNALKTEHSEELINSKEYEKYSCFYCEKDIASEAYLLEHRVTCHGAAETPSLFSFPVRPRALLYKCAICGLVAVCEADIVNHKKSVHKSQ